MTRGWTKTCLSRLGRIIGWGILLSGIAVALVAGWRLWLYLSHRPLIYSSVAEVPARKVAIVFGAGVRDSRPEPVLADRLETAAALYHAGKVHKLLMSGGNRFGNFNEPAAMQIYAQELGVPVEDIVLDYAGRRSYDTCYRARAIFGLEEAILVTQYFHQARVLYLCRHLGVDALGVAAANRRYLPSTQISWEVREALASAAAWLDINIRRPTPVLGDPIPIPD